MTQTIDVSDLPQPLVDAIETMIRAYRDGSTDPNQASRTIGWAKGILPELPDAFFEPLPDDLLDLFGRERIVKILLDTATFWWIAVGSNRLTARAVEIFLEPSNDISLSPISVWELLVKHQIGKLPTSEPIADLIARARNQRMIRSLPVVDTAVMRLESLPMLHRDPFDRLLICQAIDEQMTLLTPDDQIRKYPVSTLW